MYKAKLIVIVILTALLAGCSASVQTPQPMSAEPTVDLPYEIIQDDGEFYLLLKDGIKKDDENEGSYSAEIPNVKFGSMAEMVQDIKTGNFSDEELEKISQFIPDKYGRIGICNLAKLYDAYTPETFDKELITWMGGIYTFRYINDSYSCLMQGEISNADKEEMIAKALDCSKIQDFAVLSTEQIEERNATVITYSSAHMGNTHESKMVYYSIEDGEKNVFVVERYGLSTDTAPYVVQIIGTENGINFYVNVMEPQERPSVEYLMGFGFCEYVETEVA